jgi:acyl-CoA thioesterase FadM
VRIAFSYQTFNENGDLLNEAYTLLVFVHAQTHKPLPIPAMVINQLTMKI